MKNKQVADRLGWRAESIKKGGKEMVESVYIVQQDQSRKLNTKVVAIDNSEKYL